MDSVGYVYTYVCMYVCVYIHIYINFDQIHIHVAIIMQEETIHESGSEGQQRSFERRESWNSYRHSVRVQSSQKLNFKLIKTHIWKILFSIILSF